MSCDQATQHPKLPSRIWGLLQHFRPDMQGFLCLIGLIQPQALLYLLLGLVLAHLWCKEPHKNIHSFRPCNFSEEAKKQILAMHSTTPKKIPWRWASERSEPEGLPGPALSAPAALRRRGNWIHQSKTATHQDHYHQTEKYLPHLTLQWSPLTIECSKILPQISVWKMPKKHVSQRRASSDIPEYLLPPHPSERNSQHPPCPTPSTFLLLLALQQMALSL